jgi:hypothetical protein
MDMKAPVGPVTFRNVGLPKRETCLRSSLYSFCSIFRVSGCRFLPTLYSDTLDRCTVKGRLAPPIQFNLGPGENVSLDQLDRRTSWTVNGIVRL